MFISLVHLELRTLKGKIHNDEIKDNLIKVYFLFFILTILVKKIKNSKLFLIDYFLLCLKLHKLYS